MIESTRAHSSLSAHKNILLRLSTFSTFFAINDDEAFQREINLHTENSTHRSPTQPYSQSRRLCCAPAWIIINSSQMNLCSTFSPFVRCECDALYHDECVKIGVKSIIAVNYDEQIADNREL
jgi:hypothetical protein